VLAVGAAAVVLLTGCSSGEFREAAGSSTSASSSSASSAAETSAPDLASGLLPPDAFGPGASVRAVPPDQLKQGAGFAASAGADLQITPEACHAAVQDTQPRLDEFDDIAAQAATVGQTATVEMLTRGGPTKNAVTQLAEAAQRCPQAQATSPKIGQARITFQNLPTPSLGDGAAVLRYTTVVSAPDGTQVTIPTLIGAVQDGNRLVMLITLPAQPGNQDAAPDPAAFTALLQQAYETQADALG
jgi:hypothetical protein